MGLLDSLKKLGTNDTLLTGLLAYGTTGQGYNPVAAGVEAMNGAAAAKAKAAKEARELAAKQAMQQAVTGAFASGSVDPALLAQYSASGGEGAKDMLDLYKFGRTPQSVAPGQMMIDPTTGKMSMPAPKMGEGQMWDGGQVTSAPGYLQAYGAQKAVDAQNSIDQYAAQQGIGHQYGVDMLNRTQNYDWDKMGAQNQFDINKTGMQNQYDWNKTGYASELAKGQDAFKAELGAEGELVKQTNPDGSVSYNSRANILRNGGLAERSPEQAAYMAERAKANATTYQASLSAAEKAGTQLANIDRMAGLFSEVGDGTGKGEQALMGLNSLAGQIGFNFDEKQGAKEAIIAITNQMALGMKEPGSGTTTDKDMDVFLATVPSIAGTPGGNEKIMDTMAVFAQRKQKEADLMRRYAAGNGGVFDDEGETALNKWRQSHPIKW